MEMNKKEEQRILVEDLKNGYKVNKNGYFDSYRENIFKKEMPKKYQEMFDNGSGGELHSKAEAVHSSSMLSYNFFHWIDDAHPFNWENVNYTQVLFEVQMKTIKGSNAPANMDVVLIDEDKKNLLFIESKFTEYFETKKFELSDSYQNKEKWINTKVDWFEIVNYKPKREFKYKEGIKQLITHLFGIHSQFVEPCDKFEKIGIDFNSVNLKFITLIFEPKKDYKEEHEAYEHYHSLVNDFSGQIEKVKGLKVVPEWKSYSDLWNVMKDQMPKDLNDYIGNRYMQFANI